VSGQELVRLLSTSDFVPPATHPIAHDRVAIDRIVLLYITVYYSILLYITVWKL